MKWDKGEPWHGTAGGYTNHACRCSACTTARLALLKKWRQKKRKARFLADNGRWFNPMAKHGTTSAYSDYGCRCFACSKASSDSRQRWKKRNASRADD